MKEAAKKYSQLILDELSELIDSIINVILHDFAFVFLPFLVIVVVKSFFLDTPFFEFAYSSKLSFAIVILYTSIITKWLEVKVEIQNNSFNHINSGIKVFVFLLIGTVILLSFVIIDEQGIIDVPDSKKNLYGYLHGGLILFAFINLMAANYAASKPIERIMSLNKTKQLPTPFQAIEKIKNDVDEINNNINRLNYFIESLEVETKNLGKKYNSKSLIKMRKQESEVVEKRISNICESVNDLLQSFSVKKIELEEIKTTPNKV